MHQCGGAKTRWAVRHLDRPRERPVRQRTSHPAPDVDASELTSKSRCGGKHLGILTSALLRLLAVMRNATV